MAYGSDVSPDAHKEEYPGLAPEPDVAPASLRARLARLEERGVPASELRALRADLEALEAKFAIDEAR
jgi:hypothetical protein